MPFSDPALCVSVFSMHPLVLCAYALYKYPVRIVRHPPSIRAV